MGAAEEISRACDGCGTTISVQETGPLLQYNMSAGSYLCPECANDAPFETVTCKTCGTRFGLTDLAELCDELEIVPDFHDFVCPECDAKARAADWSAYWSAYTRCSHCNQADGVHYLHPALDDTPRPDLPVERWLCDECWNRPGFRERRLQLEESWQARRELAMKIFEEMLTNEASDTPVTESGKQGA